MRLACWSDDVCELERRLESGADTDDGRATVEEQVERKHRTSSLQHRQGNRRHQTFPRHSLYDGLVWSLSPPSSKDTTQAAGALACTRRCCDVTRCNGIGRRSKSRWNGNSSRKKSASNDDRLSGSLDPGTPGHQIRMDYSVRILQQLETYYIAGTVSAKSLGRREQDWHSR